MKLAISPSSHCCVAVFAIAGLAAAGAAAQPAASQVCGRIIDHGLNNISMRTSGHALADRTYWNFCDESYERMSDAKRAEFGATIKGIPLSASGDSQSTSERHRKFCGDYKTSSDVSSQEALMTSRMHDRAIDAWRSCVTAQTSGMLIDFRIPANQRYADIFLKYTGPTGQTNFNGIESTGFTCKVNDSPIGPGSKLPLSPAETAIRCERQFITQDIGGVTSEYYPDGGITVKTDAGNSSTEFVAMIDGPAKNRFSQVDTQMAGIRNDLGTLSTSLLSWNTSDPQRGNMIGGGDESGTTTCPTGQYAVGFQYWGAPRHIRHCVGCASGFQIICRPLNSTGVR